ncbi:MAG: tetratricopeptide repeat protein [Treponema sp.]
MPRTKKSELENSPEKKAASKTASKTAQKKPPAKKPAEKKSVTKTESPQSSTKKTAAKTTARTSAGTSKTSVSSAVAKPKTTATKTTAKTASTTAKKTPSKQAGSSQGAKAVQEENLDLEIEQRNKEISALLKDYSAEAEISEKPAEKKPGVQNSTFFKKYFKIAAAVLVLLIILLLLIGRCSNSGGNAFEKERQNTISLVKKYMDKGQYEPAMDLLNGLLIKNADDEEVQELLDRLIELKAIKDAENSAMSNGMSNGSVPYDINIDTNGITNAFRDSIDSMSRELSAANEANAKNQEAINRLLEAQRQEELERQSQKKALEEQKAKEAAMQKAQEEELARQNKKNAEKIEKINELIKLGNASLNTGKNDDAIKKYEEAVKLLPLDQGEPKFSASKYSEIASNLYDAAERENNPEVKNFLMQKAVSYAQKAIDKDSGNAKSHFILAMNAEKNKDSQTAERELELAVKNDSGNYLYYYYLGRRQYLNKKYSEARTSFISSIKLKGDFDSSHYNLGITCKKLNLSQEALSSFRKAYGVNPQHAKAYLEEARILDSVYANSDGAIKAYNKVLEIEPDNMSALKECGSVYAKVGNYAKAESYFRRAVAKTGSKADPMLYYNLSTVLYNQNKIQDAEKYALEAYNSKDLLNSNSEKAKIVYNYALIVGTAGNQNKSIELYNEVLKLNPSHTKAKINLGIMFMEMTPPETDTALLFLTQAYKEDDKNFEVNNNLGNAYLLKKQYKDAVNYYLKASKINPKDVEVKQNLAKAYAESGQFDNAKVTYEEVIAQSPDSFDTYIELAKVCIALKDNSSAEGYLTALQTKKPEYKASEVKSLLAAIKN